MTVITFWAAMLCTMLYGYAVGFELLFETKLLCGAAACLFSYWNAREVQNDKDHTCTCIHAYSVVGQEGGQG